MTSKIRWTISKKVGGTVFILLSFILALLLHSVLSLQQIGKELREIAEVDVPLSEHASEIEIAQLEQRILFDELLRKQLLGNADFSEEKKNMHQWNKRIYQEFSLALETLNKGINTEDAATFKELKQSLIQLKSHHKEMEKHFVLLLEQGFEKDKVAQLIELDVQFDHGAIALLHAIEKVTQQKANLALEHERQFELINYSLSMIALIIGVALAAVIVISIKSSIGKMFRNIERVTTAIQSKEGIPLEDVEHVKSSDELSALSANLSDMISTVSSDIEERESKSKKLTEQVIKDHLTGCFNRLKWDIEREAAIQKSLADATPLSLIFFDIDHFKRVNDNFGHDVGDSTLIDVVKICQHALRRNDTLYRTGGEEFSILLPDIELPHAQLLAERLREKVEEYTFDKVEQVTISLGVTHFLGEHDTSGDFSKRADEALYASKNNGRNQVNIQLA